jgi:methylmalonyl-CoA mutase
MAARATVGEVSAALERVWGRYMPNSATVTGAYGQQYENDPRWHALQSAVGEFERSRGRKPRLLVAKLGQDGHDRGAKLIASGFADVGFDVDLAPMFRTPAEVAQMAVDHDVHVVGISTQAGAHSELVPELIQALAELDAPDVAVVCGGVIPEADRQGLLNAGVADVFTTGTSVPDCIERVLAVLTPAEDAPGVG